MQVSAEDFEAWRDNRVTQWVAEAFRIAALENKRACSETAWTTGVADQASLTECRTRADAYMAIAEMNHDDLCEMHGDEDAE